MIIFLRNFIAKLGISLQVKVCDTKKDVCEIANTCIICCKSHFAINFNQLLFNIKVLSQPFLHRFPI